MWPVGLLLVLASPVAAQDQNQQSTTNGPRHLAIVTVPPDSSEDADARPAALGPLYVSMIGLHVLDVHSTWQVLSTGGSESNPLVRSFVGSPAGVVAIKAGSSAAVIYAAEKMWKHNRTAAVVMMVGINSAYAAVVAHNYRASHP